MGIVFDIVLVGILLLFIIIGYKKGAVKTLIGFLGSIVAVVAAFVLSFFLADALFSLLFRTPLLNAIDGTLNDSTGLSVAEQINAVLDALPGFISNAIHSAGTQEQISSALAGGVQNAAEAIVDYVARPVVVMLLRIILVVLLMIVFSLVVKLVAKTGDRIARLPLLTQLNSLLGVVIGLIKGAFILLLLTAVLRICLPMVSSPQIFTEENIKSSSLFQLVYEQNPLFRLLEPNEG